jgi:uncharacterized protein (TIGR02246 family)
MTSQGLIDGAGVEQLFDLWAEAVTSGDVERVVALYAPDAVLLPTLSNTLRRNPSEIAEYFAEFLLGRPQPSILQGIVRDMGEVAVFSGVYRFAMTALPDRPEIDARFTFVYQRQNAGWTIVAHHSSVMPVM